MNCQQLLEQLGDYLGEDDTAEATRAKFEDLCKEIEAHLVKCPDCRVVVDKTKKIIILYQVGQDGDVPGLSLATVKLQTALGKAYHETESAPVD